MLNAASQDKSSDGTITPASAIRTAWILWITLGTIPMILFLYSVFDLLDGKPGPGGDGTMWFVVASVYLILVVPVSFFGRSRLFKAYWVGQHVHPVKYLAGMTTMWLALVIGGLFSLTGCLRYHALLPNLLPALVAFMFFVTLWPSGRAMTHHGGSSEDAEVYEEPN